MICTRPRNERARQLTYKVVWFPQVLPGSRKPVPRHMLAQQSPAPAPSSTTAQPWPPGRNLVRSPQGLTQLVFLIAQGNPNNIANNPCATQISGGKVARMKHTVGFVLARLVMVT